MQHIGSVWPRGVLGRTSLERIVHALIRTVQVHPEQGSTHVELGDRRAARRPMRPF